MAVAKRTGDGVNQSKCEIIYFAATRASVPSNVSLRPRLRLGPVEFVV